MLLKRRAIIIPTVILAFLSLGLGIAYYIRQGTGDRLLNQARIAIKAKQYDKARELAHQYHLNNDPKPASLRIEAEGCLYMGKYDEARELVDKAIEIANWEIVSYKLKATTYSLPSNMTIDSYDKVNETQLIEAIKGLIGPGSENANTILRQATTRAKQLKTPPEDEIILLQHAIALNYAKAVDGKFQMLRKIGRRRREADDANNESLWKELTKRHGDVARELQTLSKEALKELVKAVVMDPAQERAPKELIKITTWAGDDGERALDKLGLIFAQARAKGTSLPPEAITMLEINDLYRKLAKSGEADRVKQIQATLKKLLALSEKHPKNIFIKSSQMKLHVDMNDFEGMARSCREILEIDPHHANAKLRLAVLALRSGQHKQAEEDLKALADGNMRDATGAYLYHYALALHHNGKYLQAITVMRNVVNRNPGHSQAWQFLTDSLYAEGSYSPAFLDAKTYHETKPNDPRSLIAYVRSACKTSRQDQAWNEINTAFDRQVRIITSNTLHELVPIVQANSPGGKLDKVKAGKELLNAKAIQKLALTRNSSVQESIDWLLALAELKEGLVMEVDKRVKEASETGMSDKILREQLRTLVLTAVAQKLGDKPIDQMGLWITTAIGANPWLDDSTKILHLLDENGVTKTTIANWAL
ncbi:MAG TPA: tetratricopeptide repeat protein, partial [Phycisphaerae bacterium]|nr:tetratricopeptide repeat protein [Phycisphaerae bacterium]